MNPEYNKQFGNWLYEKYKSVWNDPEWNTEKSDEWFDSEFKEFKKFHPAAGIYVRNLTPDQFIEWINKLKK